MKTVVIAAQREDMHAHAVRSAATRLGCDAHILDIQEFTEAYDLVASIGMTESELDIRSRKTSRQPDLREISGLWWRRPYPPVDKYRRDTPHNVFSVVSDERRSAVIGSLDAFVPFAFNDLGRSRQAAHKPTQLMRARALGLRIPETLITNDARAVKAFYERTGGHTIYKMFRGSPLGLYGTRRLEKDDLDDLPRLQGCPAIFQEYIDGEYDIRAIVVGDQVFAARLVYESLTDFIDTRFVETEISAYAPPRDIEDRLVRLVAEFGLVYSAIDLRYSSELGYVFFESNPEGQYLWLEIEAGLSISHAIAERLATGAEATAPAPSRARGRSSSSA
jgi:hypothetical protein